MCNENDLFHFFNFPNKTQARDLQSQLCNLTVEQGLELFNDFRDNLDLSSALSEVNMHVCVRVCMCVCVCVCV